MPKLQAALTERRYRGMQKLGLLFYEIFTQSAGLLISAPE
jgi:hypothetical protein